MKIRVQQGLYSAIAGLILAMGATLPSHAQKPQTSPPPPKGQIPLPPADLRFFSPEANPAQTEEEKELELEQQLNYPGDPNGINVQEIPAPLQIYQDNVPTSPESQIQIKSP